VVEAPAPVEASTRPRLPADWSRLSWDALIEQLPLKGMAKMLAVHAAAEHLSPEAIALVVDEDNETCVSERTTRELELALREALHPALKLSVRVGNVVAPTPLMRMDERRSQAQAAAEHAAEHDPVMVGLKAGFGARVIPGSVRPVG
jgi:DNA polymerase-3 subunit gamma/tau